MTQVAGPLTFKGISSGALWPIAMALHAASCASAAAACECAAAPLADRVCASDAVFLGEVSAPRPDDHWAGHDAVRVTVVEPFFGRPKNEVTVQDMKSSCDASLPGNAKAGERLLMFVRYRQGR